MMTGNYGHADVHCGDIDSDRLVFESLKDAWPRLRFTWDVSDPA